jgi:hypothetical protein
MARIFRGLSPYEDTPIDAETGTWSITPEQTAAPAQPVDLPSPGLGTAWAGMGASAAAHPPSLEGLTPNDALLFLQNNAVDDATMFKILTTLNIPLLTLAGKQQLERQGINDPGFERGRDMRALRPLVEWLFQNRPPQGSAAETLRAIGNPAIGLWQGVGAAGDMGSAYVKMRLDPIIGMDKYYHALGNAAAGQQGPIGNAIGQTMSDVREWRDRVIKGNDAAVIANDQTANLWGQYMGLRFPEADPYVPVRPLSSRLPNP